MGSSVIAIVGTSIAALIALFSAIYTSNQGKKSQDVTSERATQLRMLEILGTEVETLNKRIIDLRSRLTVAEDFADSERTKRRDVEQRLEDVVENVDRVKEIIMRLPNAADPAIQRIIQGLVAPDGP